MDVRADRFPLVDSLRAIAAMTVIVYHGAFYAGTLDEPSAVTRLLTNVQAGVPIFFLVSAFLLYRPYTRARLRGEPLPRTLAYGWRRFLRIAPAYWVALTLAVALGLAVNLTGSNWPIYYLFGQIYTVPTYAGGLSQAWTLCVEVTFYAMLPVWALAMRSLPTPRSPRHWLRQELLGLGALIALSQAYKVVVVLSTDVNSFGSQPLLMPLPNFLDALALGMMIAVASVWLQETGRSWRPVELLDAHSWLPWAVAALAFAVACVVGPSGEIGQTLTRTDFLLRHELWTLCALGLCLPAMLGDPGRGWVRALMARRTLLFLGLISYGLFLYHITVYLLLERWGVLPQGGEVGLWPLWTAVGLVGAVVFGSLSYYAIERPALSLKRLVPARRAQAQGEALAEPAPALPPRAAERSAAAR
jgi:peptidoglycan/LPS O-acetylase OafA/YrhL